MKARVKATGEIVDVYSCGERYLECSNMNKSWWEEELDFEVTDKDVIYNKGWQDGWDEAVKSEIPKIHPKLKGSDPDYWTRLEHQYAGMAMQGLLANHYITDRIDVSVLITETASAIAHALVEKVRYEENPKELEGLKKELEALKIEKTILENKIKLLKEERK